MKNTLLLFNTLRYLKFKQISYRILRKLIKPKVTEKYQNIIFKPSNLWQHLTIYDNKFKNKSDVCFLNYSKCIDLPLDWNNESPSKLWVYNLHYFEDLLSINSKDKKTIHQELINTWIDQNPVGHGNGWEPYPTSLRIVNILKAWLGGLELDNKTFNSVFQQASFLSNNLEKHLLGNHYFVNLKALLFAGLVFKNKKWLKLAEKELAFEIPEQILEDGANFELSPMYHSLMLVDMLDIYNLSRAYSGSVSNEIVCMLEANIPKMLKFLQCMTHPDGGVAFFNDSVDGIAPSKEKIESYAKKLGFKITNIDEVKCQIIDNINSGYICANLDKSKIIFDASPVGPDYIPGHAHADTLSFELSIGSQRVFVNSGISEYGISATRLNQRKTKSHNTVEVDGKDSSQVWSGFRVANRAKVINRTVNLKPDNIVEFAATHDGYKSLIGGCYHSRRLTFSKDKLIVTDLLKGKFKDAVARFYFHPDLLVSLEEDLLIVHGPKFILKSILCDKKATIINSFWHPEFGIKKSNKVLEVKFNCNELKTTFSWAAI